MRQQLTPFMQSMEDSGADQGSGDGSGDDDDDEGEEESTEEGTCAEECIYQIPCCGGFCAPTENPDESCFRHGSNEYTLPAGMSVFLKAAPVVEYSPCCIACGKVGCRFASRRRKRCALGAATITVVGLLLSVYSLLGCGTSAALLRAAHWSHGRVTFERALANATVDYFIGLNAQLKRYTCRDELCRSKVRGMGAVETGDGAFDLVVEWGDDEACDLLPGENGIACTECKRSALGTVVTVISSCVTYWPQLLTNLQRSTRFGDVNCQSTMGATTALFPGTATSLAALSAFAAICNHAMPAEVEGARIEWNLGPGFICLLTATFLKLADFAYHIGLPTPSARWRKPTGEAATDIVAFLGSTAARRRP